MAEREPNKKVILAAGIVAFGLLMGNWLLNTRGTSDVAVPVQSGRVAITSSAFEDMGAMPVDCTGKGADLSPDLHLADLSDEAVSIAIIMDDLDVPWQSNYTHWTIWNIPAMQDIPGAIPHGAVVESLGGATQGMGYGQNRYRGPNPPFGSHRYQFHVFVLDTVLDLDPSAGKAELMAAMNGHILQYGSLTGWYPKVK